jgi:hypothetical protein
MMVKIDLEGFAELDAAWRLAPDIVREEMTAAMLESDLLLEREVKEKTPVGVGGAGGLKGSIAAQEPEISSDVVLGVVGTAMAHAVPVEIGTRPHFPPVQPLEDWVIAKLGVPEKDAHGVAFLVARKIAARGTLAVGMFHRAFNEQRPKVEAIFAAARQRIAERLARPGA